jgi:hypothetical protein
MKRKPAAQVPRLQSLLLRGATLVLVVACASNDATHPAAGDTLPVGTWGGENAGVIVSDSIAHVHIACTLGNIPAPVVLQARGSFDVAGTYVLRAFPIHIGPDLPARFTGTISGNRLTLRVAVNDTVEKKTVNLGPVTVTLGREPKMGPCPICTSQKVDQMRRGS